MHTHKKQARDQYLVINIFYVIIVNIPPKKFQGNASFGRNLERVKESIFSKTYLRLIHNRRESLNIKILI